MDNLCLPVLGLWPHTDLGINIVHLCFFCKFCYCLLNNKNWVVAHYHYSLHICSAVKMNAFSNWTEIMSSSAIKIIRKKKKNNCYWLLFFGWEMTSIITAHFHNIWYYNIEQSKQWLLINDISARAVSHGKPTDLHIVFHIARLIQLLYCFFNKQWGYSSCTQERKSSRENNLITVFYIHFWKR